METIEHIQRVDPGTVIASIRQRISVMGANDSESSELDSIFNKWERGQLSDAEAIAAAEQVENNKQDYH